MKKVILLTTAIAFTIASCSNNDDDITKKEITIVGNPNQTGTVNYSYYLNSKLEIVDQENSYIKWANIKDGNNLVFEYHFIADDDEQIADDEYSETIRFEIDPTLDEFTYTDNSLENINTTLTKYCFCWFQLSDSKSAKPKGTISGKKVSENEWEINLDIIFFGDEKRSFSKQFLLTNRDF